jgi:hypothetical protein
MAGTSKVQLRIHGRLSRALWFLCFAALLIDNTAFGDPVSFRNDVMAVLSKAGCNAGTCHGNKNGKGGFKLSLRGQDPDIDFAALTRDLFARRIDPLDPDQSLMLLKPTTQIAHEGGLRFRKDSELHEILRRWISEGMTDDAASAAKLERIEVTPADKILIEPSVSVQLSVRAGFSDGTWRDVTNLAVYETSNGLAKVGHDGTVQRIATGETTVLVRFLQCQEPVRIAFVPARPKFTWSDPPYQNYIDAHIFAKLRTLRMNPSELCSDDVFLRRAYLDLLGILPTAEEARAFVNQDSRGSRRRDSQSPDSAVRTPTSEISQSLLTSAAAIDEAQVKRVRLIDQLLERPEFADFWALKWSDLLRNEAHSLDEKGVLNFHHWIRQGIAENKPIDQFVRELVSARGSTYQNPAANYYRPNREPAVRAKATAQVFLGVRLQCAECHNHPFDRWTQDDYYDWASVFGRVNYKVLENKRDIGSDKHEWKGEQVVFMSRQNRVQNPRTGKPAPPRFLGSASPLTDHASRITASERDQDELQQLAAWLTSPNNPLFARTQANRIWYHLMGRGIVEPIDDFRATNPASHPELLEALADDFVKSKFDLRHLIRLIMNSRTYQLSSEPNETNESDESNFSHVLVRRLGAEQLLDCQSQVAGVPLKFNGYPAGLRSAQLPGVRPEAKGKRRANQLDQFLEVFGKPPRLLTSEMERSCECNMGQAFQLISGPTVNDLIAEKDNRIAQLMAAGKSNRQIVEELYWISLTSAPGDEELSRSVAYVEGAKDRRIELEDILWGLLNSKDFVFRK